ncbi:MAG: hypothetical protein M3Y70_02450 [Pseudomonadota bacterium]|nr:hypothetical protein [Pseudomonadota bacterium]
MRKNIIIVAVLASLLSAGPSQAADESEIIAAGSVCQPATPADGASIDYLEGRTRANAAVDVTCAFPPVPPGYAQVRAELYFSDARGYWSKNRCRFYNAGSARHDARVEPHPASPNIGVARFIVDEVGFPAHAVVCNLLPGQSVYAATTVVRP